VTGVNISEPTAADLADLEGDPEELIPVVIAVHNGLVVEGRPMFIPSYYMVPISELLYIQRRLNKHECGDSEGGGIDVV